MSSTIVESWFFAAAKVPLILLILFNLWLLVINPICRLVVGWLVWAVMWELSALSFLNYSTPACRSRNGGRLERNPERLDFEDWILHNSCVGREDGFDEFSYGIIAIFGLAVLAMLVAFVAGASSRYIRVLRVNYHRFESAMFALVDLILVLSTIISATVTWLLRLAELFVVTKPVELSQVVLDRKVYDQLVKDKAGLEGRVSDLQVQMVPLEQIAQWCKSWHADPDARKMKYQTDQLAKNQRDLDELRRRFSSVQATNKDLTAHLGPYQRSKVAELQIALDSKESELLSLRATISALEVRLDDLKGETAVFEKKIQVMTLDQSNVMCQAALEREERARLEKRNLELQEEIKAAAERAQAPVSSRCEQLDLLEERLSATEYDLGKAQEEAKTSGETVEKLQHILQYAQQNEAAFKACLRAEVESFRTQLQTRFDQILEASLRKAEAAEADFNARVEESVAARTRAALIESAEAAEAELASRFEAQLAARVAEALSEHAAATEAAIKSRVDEQLAARVVEAVAEKAEAEAAAATLDGDLDFEFEDAVLECLDEMTKARAIEAAAVKSSSTINARPLSEGDATMSDGPPVPAAMTFSLGRPVAFICSAPKPEQPVRGAPARKRAKGPERQSSAPERSPFLSASPQAPAASAPAPAPTAVVTPARPQSLWKLRPIRPRGERSVDAGVDAAGPAPAGPPRTPSDVPAAAVGGRRRASGRVPMPMATDSGGIPGLGQLSAQEVARGLAQKEAAAHAAFSSGKFHDPEQPDIEKPHGRELEPDPTYYLENSDLQWQ